MFHGPDDIRYWSGEVGVYGAVKGVIVSCKRTRHGIKSSHFRVAESHTNIVLRWGSKK